MGCQWVWGRNLPIGIHEKEASPTRQLTPWALAQQAGLLVASGLGSPGWDSCPRTGMKGESVGLLSSSRIPPR